MPPVHFAKEKRVPEKDPWIQQVIAEFGALLYATMLGAFAGLVGYLNRLERRRLSFNLLWLFAAMLTGGLNGYLVFLLCDLAGFSWQFTSFMAGAAGALGSEALHKMLDIARLNLTRRENGNRY